LIKLFGVLNQTFFIQNPHFLPNKHEKPIFHKNLDVFFIMFRYIHASNTLLVDDTQYKNMFNDLYNAMFLEYFDSRGGDDHYLLRFILLYLENLHSSRYDIPTFVKDNPFGRIRCINQNDQRHF
jgi:hypothetical protein